MSFGIRIFNAAGNVKFDSSRSGGVVIDSFNYSYTLQDTPTTQDYWYYDLPVGCTMYFTMSKSAITGRDDLVTVTANVTGTTGRLTISTSWPVYLNITVFIV